MPTFSMTPRSSTLMRDSFNLSRNAVDGSDGLGQRQKPTDQVTVYKEFAQLVIDSLSDGGVTYPATNTDERCRVLDGFVQMLQNKCNDNDQQQQPRQQKQQRQQQQHQKQKQQPLDTDEWKQERNVWALIHNLFTDRFITDDDEYEYGNANQQTFSSRVNIDNISEKVVVEEMKSKNKQYREYCIVADWLEQLYKADLDMRCMKEPTKKYYENTKNQAQNQNSYQHNNKALKLDPDAQHREANTGFYLDRYDKETEKDMMMNVFKLIRAGDLEQAQNYAELGGHAWFSAVLEGLKSYDDEYADVGYGGFGEEGDDNKISGNCDRAGWENGCLEYINTCDDIDGEYERALLSLFGGKVDETALGVCDSYEDALWCYLNVMKQKMIRNQMRNIHRRCNQSTNTNIDLNLNSNGELDEDVDMDMDAGIYVYI